MPLPTGRQIYYDVPLTNVSVSYAQTNREGFVSGQVFPVVPVNRQSGKFYTYDKGDWFRGGSKPRAPSTESAGGGFRTSMDDYSCSVYALHDDVSWQDKANADGTHFDLEADAAEWVTQQMMIDREVDWVNSFMSEGVWSVEKAGNTDFDYWDDYTSSTPAENIEEQRLVIQRTTGFKPNFMVVTPDVHSKLKFHPLVKDQYKYTSADSITAAMIAKVFEIEKYLVAGGIKNYGEEGGTDDMQFMASGKMLLGYAAPAPGLRRPSAGYTFAWTGYLGSAYAAPQIDKFDLRRLKATRVEGEMAYSQKVVAADLAVLFTDVLTPT